MKISSTNKRILVVSDIHQDIQRLHSIIRYESPDNIVVLGDWFDSHYSDNLDDYTRTAKYLLKFVHQDNTITLWGNHDLHYFYTNDYLCCSGYRAVNDEAITEALHPAFNDVKEKFKWYIWIDDILCTHAGLYPSFISPTVKNNDDIAKFLIEEEAKIRTKIVQNEPYWAYCAGRARGGQYPRGGITWLDFEHEFDPIVGLRQIVGHTFSRTGKIRAHYKECDKNVADADNICIDCNLNEYLIIHNGTIHIKKFEDI